MHNDPFAKEDDESLNNIMIYEGFWRRFVATVLDGLIVGVPAAALTFYNLMYLKDFWFYLLITVIATAYKPLMEGFYGATLGKMSLGMKVVDYEGEQINAPQAILRSIFTIAQVLVTLPVYWFVYQDTSLMAIESYFTLSLQLAETYPFLNLISALNSGILFGEVILLLMDQPYWRSLHDRIAKTYVVEA